jgi:hypothetical protein
MEEKLSLDEIYKHEILPLTNIFQVQTPGARMAYFKLFVTTLDSLHQKLVERGLEIIENEPYREEEISIE